MKVEVLENMLREVPQMEISMYINYHSWTKNEYTLFVLLAASFC